MQKEIGQFVLAFFITLLFVSSACAATISCNGSQSDCQAKVNGASDGDTITIPSGSFSWSTPVTWTDKNITILGAGIGSTTIKVSNNYAFKVNAESKSSFRISSMKIFASDANFDGVIRIQKSYAPAGYGWRIDHIEFVLDALSGDKAQFGISINGITNGVIDNCIFTALKHTCLIHVYANVQSEEPLKGIAAWSIPLAFGSKDAVYIENCTFNYTESGVQVLDVWMGGKVVFRHNTVAKGHLTVHPALSQFRAGYSLEVYNNVFTGYGWYRPSDIRGGTGVIFNNLVSGYQVNNFAIRNDRCTTMPGDYGWCNGSAVVDGNISANGWPCEDQIGRRGGTLRNQASEPYYAWNNGSTSLDGSVKLVLGVASENAWIKTIGDANPHPGGIVDYINNAPKPGYTPYIYPHPLRMGSTSTTSTTTATAKTTTAITDTSTTAKTTNSGPFTSSDAKTKLKRIKIFNR